jgi:putative ABC transport system permease protein
VIVVGVACVVGVLLSMLSITAGMLRAYHAGDDPRRVIILPRTGSGGSGGLSQAAIDTILGAPGVARGPVGRPLADAELVAQLPPVEGFSEGSLDVLGVGPAGISIRQGWHIAQGRMFVPGLRELVIGRAAQRVFGLQVGDPLVLPNGDWRIVGVFTVGGGILESSLIADAPTLRAAMGSSESGEVVAQLESPSSFSTLQAWLSSNPQLTVTAERQVDHDLRGIAGLQGFFTVMALGVTAMLALGALFGVVNIMHGAVSARAGEIATLRALGYRSLPIALSVVLESVLLCLTGAALGAAAAWLLSDGRFAATGAGVFASVVSPRLLALGVAWALALALLGSLFPAVRAGRLTVAAALLSA